MDGNHQRNVLGAEHAAVCELIEFAEIARVNGKARGQVIDGVVGAHFVAKVLVGLGPAELGDLVLPPRNNMVLRVNAVIVLEKERRRVDGKLEANRVQRVPFHGRVAEIVHTGHADEAWNAQLHANVQNVRLVQHIFIYTEQHRHAHAQIACQLSHRAATDGRVAVVEFIGSALVGGHLKGGEKGKEEEKWKGKKERKKGKKRKDGKIESKGKEKKKKKL